MISISISIEQGYKIKIFTLQWNNETLKMQLKYHMEELRAWLKNTCLHFQFRIYTKTYIIKNTFSFLMDHNRFNRLTEKLKKNGIP